MVVRAGSIDASVPASLAKEVDRARNIRVRVNTQVVEAFGEGRLEGVRLRHRVSGTIEAARTRALFVMMGADPNTDWLKGSMVRDDQGYLVTGNELVRNGRLPEGWIADRAPLMLETSVPRVFAAGDVRRGAVRRVTSAILEGQLAVMLARRVLRESFTRNGNRRRSLFISAIVALWIATSLPAAPIAMPISPAESAGASFTPSPTTATL